MKEIIGFIGVIGSGKDFAANQMADKKQGLLFDFSDGVREFTFGFLGFRPQTREDYDNFKQTNNSFLFTQSGKEFVVDIPGRKFLTNVGITLRNYDKDFWAKYTCTRAFYSYHRGMPRDLIFNAVRYPNEAMQMLVLSRRLGKLPVKFYFTNYKSSRYKLHEDESEDFAKYFVNKGCLHMEDITDLVLAKIGIKGFEILT